jgi:hypothetical protein
MRIKASNTIKHYQVKSGHYTNFSGRLFPSCTFTANFLHKTESFHVKSLFLSTFHTSMAAIPDIYSRDPSLCCPGHTSGSQNKLNPPISPEAISVQYHIAVIIQNLDGLAHLVLLPLHPSFDPAKCMKKIRHEYRDALCKLRKSPCSFVFTKSIIRTAQVQLVRNS